VKVMFWRGTRYSACWVSENNKWMADQSRETGGNWYLQDGSRDDMPTGCMEHMSDVQCRSSRVAIIENNDARVVVNWRYLQMDVKFRQNDLADNTRFGEWGNELYYIYPDGVAIRKVLPGRGGWQETILLNTPGTRPEDNVELEACTLINMDGKSKTYTWEFGYPKFDLEDANIQLINFKSEFKPFLILREGGGFMVFNGEVRPEYQIHKAICPECGIVHKGRAPEGVNAPAQYGNGVKAYAVLLNVHFKLPFKKIQLLFGDLFGYSINESTVYSATQQCYQELEKSEEMIKTKVAESQVAHADETGLRVAGKLHWLHTATTSLYTYLFVHEKRGALALKSDKSILDRFTGWLVHDCWSSYFGFAKFKHAICGAHILRELQGLIENGERKWANIFKMFLMNVYQMPFEKRVKRRRHIVSKYRFICDLGEKAEPPPKKTPGSRGRYKRTKGRNLVERLIREQDAVLAFAFNKEVPFTNNLAERDIRPAKVKQKISNCFRTFTGAEIYARIEGFVSTARKQNRNVYSELCDTFKGYNFITK